MICSVAFSSMSKSPGYNWAKLLARSTQSHKRDWGKKNKREEQECSGYFQESGNYESVT